MVQRDTLSDDIRALRRCVRDLVALSALPAIWSAYDVQRIAESLADVLLGMLHLDFIYVSVKRHTPDVPLDVARTEEGVHTAEQAHLLGSALAPWLNVQGFRRSLSIRNPLGSGSLHIAVTPIGLGAEHGVLIAGSRRLEFATEAESLLLTVGANQVAILFGRFSAEEERHQHLQREAQRTIQLRQLAEASLLINAELSLDRVCQAVTDKAREIIGAHQAVLAMPVDEHGEQAFHAISLSDQAHARRSSEGQLDASGLYVLVDRLNNAVRQSHTALDENPAWSSSSKDVETSLSMRGWLAAPLTGRDGRNIGLIHLSEKDEGAFTADDEAILVQLAQMASVAIENSRLYRQAQEEIRERQRAEAQLRRSEQELADFFNNAAMGLHWVGPDGSILRVNQAELNLLGYCREEYVGRHIAEFHVDPHVSADILRRLHAGEELHNYEARLVCKDGSINHVLIDANVLWEEGQFIHARCFTRDITAQKQAEAAVQQAYAELERRVQERTALLEMMQDITRAANEATSSAEALQFAVDRICAYTGWPVGHVYLAVAAGADRWAPTSIWHLDAPERFAAFQQATQVVEFAVGEGLIGRIGALGKPEWSGEMTTNLAVHRRRAALEAGLTAGFALPILVGHEVAGVLEFYTTEMMAPHRPLLEAMTQIGTQLGRAVERERAAEQFQRQQDTLLQREKLAAMGSLLASVAHELNNPLAVIMMQADLLSEESKYAPQAEQAKAITQAAERCMRIVHNFLTLARQHPPERQAVALNTVVEGVMELLVYGLRVDNIEVEWQLADNLPRLWVDPHQLHQVMVNLVTNAHQALREVPLPRRLTLTTRYDPLQTCVILEVADTGPGIPPAIQARIFEPFFTTKPPGVGTGLGLPLCRGIIEAHAGSISVHSQPGQGSVFRIVLPVPAEASTRDGPPGTGAPPPVHKTAKTILVVDDEPGITLALAYLLRRDGHTVDTAANGQLALTKLYAHAYDLMLCDLRMPGLDGPGLYRELERHHPELCQRIIFLTGDTLSPETRAFLEKTGVPRLTKPFTAAQVRQAMQRALEAL
jgi:two-component system NtrC family sensor kinase